MWSKRATSSPATKERTVTQDPSAALSVALAYYHGWMGKDVDRAMTHVADDIVCETPTGRIEGVEGFRQFMAPFAQMLTSSDLITAFGNDETAVLMYNPHTTLDQDAAEGGPVEALVVGLDVLVEDGQQAPVELAHLLLRQVQHEAREGPNRAWSRFA